MTAHHLAAIEAAIVAMKPPGVLSIDVRYQYGFDVTMVFNVVNGTGVAAAFDCTTVAAAFEKADGIRKDKIASSDAQIVRNKAQISIAEAEVASWVPVARPGWPIERVAIFADADGRN